jgi:hypothetical protein
MSEVMGDCSPDALDLDQSCWRIRWANFGKSDVVVLQGAMIDQAAFLPAPAGQLSPFSVNRAPGLLRHIKEG